MKILVSYSIFLIGFCFSLQAYSQIPTLSQKMMEFVVEGIKIREKLDSNEFSNGPKLTSSHFFKKMNEAALFFNRSLWSDFSNKAEVAKELSDVIHAGFLTNKIKPSQNGYNPYEYVIPFIARFLKEMSLNRSFQGDFDALVYKHQSDIKKILESPPQGNDVFKKNAICDLIVALGSENSIDFDMRQILKKYESDPTYMDAVATYRFKKLKLKLSATKDLLKRLFQDTERERKYYRLFAKEEWSFSELSSFFDEMNEPGLLYSRHFSQMELNLLAKMWVNLPESVLNHINLFPAYKKNYQVLYPLISKQKELLNCNVKLNNIFN